MRPALMRTSGPRRSPHLLTMSANGKPAKAAARGASSGGQPRRRGLADQLFAPIDNFSLVFFRLAFGTIMLWEVLRYFGYGWVKHHWIDPRFYFKFYGFEWLQPWPGDGMYYHFVLLGVLAFFILVGLWYRVATILFFPAFAYVFLLDRTWYPGFPFWPSWSVYDSRLPAAMQRFSHCCQVRYSFRCRSGLRMLADHGVPAKPEGPLATPLPRRPSATRVRWLFRAVDVTLRAQVAPKFAAACRRTTSGSDAPPQAATNNIARASRAVRPSSSADAASSSATSF